jgi:hypothetical protein
MKKKMFRVTASKFSMNILKIQTFYTSKLKNISFWFQKIKTFSDCDTNQINFKLTLSSQILQEIIIFT